MSTKLGLVNTMRVVESGRDGAAPIEQFESEAAFSRSLCHGAGEAHVYVIHVDPGGEIGPHEAGFDQLFLVIEGSGWGADADGDRVTLQKGQAALFRRGEIHSKGSDDGMVAVMVQIRDMDTPQNE